MNHNHPVYQLLDSLLDRTQVYTVDSVIEFLKALKCPGIHEAEVQDALRVACNVAKVRQITNKRPQRYDSPALTILHQYVASQPAEAKQTKTK